MVQLKWHAKRFTGELNTHIMRTMSKIVLFLEAQVKVLISRGNITGSDPSKPGEPPKVRTGTLRSNISTQVEMNKGQVIGFIGVRRGLADSYANLLEEKGIRDGTKRPYLRPTVLKNRVRILNMLG